MFKALIHITLKKSILDPQGNATKKGLEHLGFSEVKDVRVGKYLEVTLEASNKTEAEDKVLEMCKQLLANLVVEDFEYELVEV